MECVTRTGSSAMENKAAPAAEPAHPDKGGKGKGKGGRGPGPKHAPSRRGAPVWGAAAAGVAAVVALAAAGGEVRAQQAPTVIVSLSADDSLPGEPVRDEDLVVHVPGQPAHVCWPSETFSLMAPEGSNGLHPVFTDIDALSERAFGATEAQRMLFSIGTDEAGFKDGDIIGVGTNGAYFVFTAEAEFIAAAGCTDGNVDIDAYQLDDDGTVLFSFGDNEVSSFLSGDTPGTIKDGDVLSWAPGAATAQILYTENQINAFVSHALGSTVTTTDTTGLARDPVSGDVLFSVQSPTNNDASVFTVANGGSLVPGQSEADFGFTGSPELDALCVTHTHYPELTTSSGKPAPGSTVVLRLHDAKPGWPHLALVSYAMGSAQFPLAGWGGFMLKQDAMLSAAIASASSLLIVPDALGGGTLTSQLPAGIVATDVVVQVISPGPDLQSSNPILLELAQ